MNTLIDKYNVPGPRYTSYPTVPHWQIDTFRLHSWKTSVQAAFKGINQSEGLSIYIHLPFCESLCTFCGCHKRITKRHDLEAPYIDTLIREWQLYLDLFGKRPLIKELHLGGGTPTFFAADQLDRLLKGILEGSQLISNPSFSFEGHPSNTTEAHLQTLKNHGFKRVSFGIQDYNLDVQKAIHRIQSFEEVESVSKLARQNGYQSVGHDLIYGLPLQTLEHIKETIRLTLQIKPDRIALYSYAHVPWLKGNGQRGFTDEQLPSAVEKQSQYQWAKSELIKAGYVEIGMDHFSLETDQLSIAKNSGKLHRNFMGYTDQKTALLIGLGMSAISDSWGAFAQNEKNLEAYQALVNQGILPIFRGHILSETDKIVRKHILNIMTRFTTDFSEQSMRFENLERSLYALEPLLDDGLITLENLKLTVTPKEQPFVRNIAMVFDQYLATNQIDKPLFSMTV